MWTATAIACYIGLAILCGRMIAADERRAPRHRRMWPPLVVILSALWLPVLAWCSAALAWDAVRARRCRESPKLTETLRELVRARRR